MKRKFACEYSNLYVLFLFILQNEPNGVRLGRAVVCIKCLWVLADILQAFVISPGTEARPKSSIANLMRRRSTL
jgi:hypothetical protein